MLYPVVVSNPLSGITQNSVLDLTCGSASRSAGIQTVPISRPVFYRFLPVLHHLSDNGCIVYPHTAKNHSHMEVLPLLLYKEVFHCACKEPHQQDMVERAEIESNTFLQVSQPVQRIPVIWEQFRNKCLIIFLHEILPQAIPVYICPIEVSVIPCFHEFPVFTADSLMPAKLSLIFQQSVSLLCNG